MRFGNGKAGVSDPKRVFIARHLAEHGPTPGDALAVAVGLTVEQFWEVVNHPWFDLTGKGYVLTDQGRAESAG